mmetsp:Transcript_59679/g.142004  ORF Transcript_59679/g.142004 Transcript_59679/m.142004 type:complete len:356 (+) Transcript_59679:137-1204(+)
MASAFKMTAASGLAKAAVLFFFMLQLLQHASAEPSQGPSSGPHLESQASQGPMSSHGLSFPSGSSAVPCIHDCDGDSIVPSHMLVSAGSVFDGAMASASVASAVLGLKDAASEPSSGPSSGPDVDVMKPEVPKKMTTTTTATTTPTTTPTTTTTTTPTTTPTTSTTTPVVEKKISGNLDFTLGTGTNVQEFLQNLNSNLNGEIATVFANSIASAIPGVEGSDVNILGASAPGQRRLAAAALRRSLTAGTRIVVDYEIILRATATQSEEQIAASLQGAASAATILQSLNSGLQAVDDTITVEGVTVTATVVTVTTTSTTVTLRDNDSGAGRMSSSQWQILLACFLATLTAMHAHRI